MRFLKYIRQWGKKVIFLVNKVDILSDSREVRQPLSLKASAARHAFSSQFSQQSSLAGRNGKTNKTRDHCLHAPRIPKTTMSMTEDALCMRVSHVYEVQVDEVANFVANNARRVLGVEAARVLPVSARSALDAKLAATKDNRGFFGAPGLSLCSQ